MVGFFGVGLGTVLLAGCNSDPKWHNIDVTNSWPPLSFTLTRASDGKEVTQAAYRGEIVLLYFGYTYCPDVCPTTLSNIDKIVRNLGAEGKSIRVLFVTVDPNRDTLKQLKIYVSNFGSQVDGLRGTPEQLAALARRYHAQYAVSPATKTHAYEVSHTPAIYVFDGAGRARLVISSLAIGKPDIAGTTADLRRLVEETHPPGLWTRLTRLI
jgi:protein SCO1